MNIDEVVQLKDDLKPQWLLWENETFIVSPLRPKKKENNRETLARVFVACVDRVQKKRERSFDQASRLLRSLWIEEGEVARPLDLPGIVGEDSFLRMYALGLPCSLDLVHRIWKRIAEPVDDKRIRLEPLYIEWKKPELHFHDVDAAPPGLLSKFFPYFRLKKDKALLTLIESDLQQVSHVSDPKKRVWLTLAILSHGAAYRELDGHQFYLPSFTEQGKVIPYVCQQHLIAEGLKTVSLVPLYPHATAIYLCQGTEFWPSQPSMLGSIIANFGEHGSATEAYAHSWRRIHQHVRDLKNPLVAGHSMGGALAMQIGLYSHSLVKEIYAFNPPVPNERDYHFYHQLSEKSKNKIQVAVNLDDFAFWRIGSKVIGKVTLFLGKKRWKYHAVGLWDCILLIPAFVKFISNVHRAFPAHQRITALYENWIFFRLTQEEIEKENEERVCRFDYLRFLPKLYDPMKVILSFIRRIFKWRLEKQYLCNEIEILALHERDLIDTLNESNKEEIERELSLLRRQKEVLIQRLKKIT